MATPGSNGIKAVDRGGRDRRVARTIGIAFGLAIWLTGAATVTAAPAERRVALVVGAGAYQHAPPLANPPNDARAMANALKALEFEVDLRLDPDRAALEQGIRQFGDRLQGAKVALFFYAGHGLQVNGRNYLVPVDANIESERSLPFSAVDMDLAVSQMEASTPVNLVFLDACRDNPFARSLARSMGTRSSAVGRGLAEISTGEGSLIVFATQPGNVAADGDQGNSPFTSALVKHLAEPGLEVRQMLTRVRQDVKERTDGRQIPWDHSSLTKDFYFIAPTIVVVPPAAPAPPGPSPRVDPLAVELSFWESIRNSQDVVDFEEYLKQYPEGRFTGIARRRIASLRSAPAPAPPLVPVTPTEPVRPESERPVAPFAARPPEAPPPGNRPPANPPGHLPPEPERTPPVPSAFDSLMEGVATNLTVGMTGAAQFQLQRSGNQVRGAIRVLPPLAATGVLEGEYRNGQCLLRGMMMEGFILEMLGPCSAAGFSGSYRAQSAAIQQQGVFQLRSVTGP